MSIWRLKICPTGCLDEAWDLAISPKKIRLKHTSGVQADSDNDITEKLIAEYALSPVTTL